MKCEIRICDGAHSLVIVELCEEKGGEVLEGL